MQEETASVASLDADDNDDDDNEEEDEEKETPGKPGHGPMNDLSHCTINFVKNTPYKLKVADNDKTWATAELVDAQPRVPPSRAGTYKAGDYVLIRGSDITMLTQGRGNKPMNVTFETEDEIVLTNLWHQFDGPMTGQDLADLENETFLMWWQNVEAPPAKRKAPAPRATTKQKAGKGKSGKS